jgi:hypothetical protein
VPVDRIGGTEDVEVAEEQPAHDRRPPPDRPGADGAPSRADSRKGAAQANEAAGVRAGEEAGTERSERDHVQQPSRRTAVDAEASGTDDQTATTDETAVAEAGVNVQPDAASTTEGSDEAPTGETPAEQVSDNARTDLANAQAEDVEQPGNPQTVGAMPRETRREPPDEQAREEDLADVPEPAERARPEVEGSGAHTKVSDKATVEKSSASIWGAQNSELPTDVGFWTSADQSAGSPGTAETTSRHGREDRPDAVAERPPYPEITDRSDYAFTDREYAFAGVSPQQAWDMHERRAPLGTRTEQWATCVGELHEALAAEGITDADVRLKGSAARFCSENPKKWFPQNENDLRAKVADHYRNAPQEVRVQRVENAAATYREAGFGQDGGKPVAPFFDSMYKLDATNDLSDYDFQVASDVLAERFQQLEKADPRTGWRSEHGGHYKHRHLERVAPALHDWAGRWEAFSDGRSRSPRSITEDHPPACTIATGK